MNINSLKKKKQNNKYTIFFFFPFFFEPPRSNLASFTTLEQTWGQLQSLNYNYTFNNYTPSVRVDSLTIAITVCHDRVTSITITISNLHQVVILVL